MADAQETGFFFNRHSGVVCNVLAKSREAIEERRFPCVGISHQGYEGECIRGMRSFFGVQRSHGCALFDLDQASFSAT